MALENFTTGQLPTQSYGVDGLTFEWTTGGADFTQSDNIQFNLTNAVDDEDTISISVDGGTATVFTFNATTPGTGVFATVAELATLLDGIAGFKCHD